MMATRPLATDREPATRQPTVCASGAWRTRLALCAAFMLAPCAAVLAAPGTDRTPLDRARAATVTLDVVGAFGDTAQGSGVIVAAGQVVTNCHVLRFARSVRVRTHDGRNFDAQPTLADGARDLCLLGVTGLKDAPVARRPAGDSPQPGETIIAIGNPLGLGLAHSTGLLTAVIDQTGSPRLIVSAPLSPGSSGGGLYDGEGRLIGITTAIFSTGQNTNLALPSAWIDELTKRGSPPPLPPREPEAEPPWAQEAERLRAAADWAGLDRWCVQWLRAWPHAREAARLRALALASLDQADGAVAQLHEALASNPRDAGLWAALADLLLLRDREAEGVEALRKARTLASVQDYADRIEAAHLWRRGKLDDALALLRRATGRDFADGYAWQMRGELAAQLQHHSEAARALLIALAYAPEDGRLLALLARMQLETGNIEAARRTLARVGTPAAVPALVAFAQRALERGHHRDAESAFERALSLAPGSEDASVRFAALLQATGRSARAAALLDALLERNPDSPHGLQIKARQHAHEKDTGGAIALLRRALVSAPEDAGILRELSALENASGDIAASIAHGRTLVTLSDATLDDRVTLAQSLLKTGDIASAEPLIEAARSEAPDDTNALIAAAHLHDRRNQLTDALALAERATVLAPSLGAAWSARGYALLRMKRFPEAIEALRTATSLQPDASNGWVNLGNALLQHRQIGEAIAALERARALSPHAFDTLLYLAQAYAGSGQLDRALPLIEQVIQLRPKLTVAWHIKGMIQTHSNDGKGLIATYRALHQIDATAAAGLRSSVTEFKPSMGALLMPQ